MQYALYSLPSEGAIALYKENSNKAIYGSNILITGFGKIGKSLCNVLKAMGSKLTVCARSDIDKAQAKTIADKVIDFKALQCQNYDPHPCSSWHSRCTTWHN